MATPHTIGNDCSERSDSINCLVSVFIPCYNETHIIERLLDSLYKQDYPRSSLEVLIVDGMSTDDTRQKIKSFAREHSDLNIRIIDNPKKRVTYALNKGLEAAKGHFLIRMDAHSIPAHDYISLCVRNLIEGKGENVGGLLDIQPINNSYVARCIAVAAANLLGSGGAQYRSGSEAGLVDTVAFGSFTRETFRRNGPFNENLMANEDYEWNTRLKKNGGRIWFDPAIRCKYFSRGSYRALAKQYFNYGYWKVIMLRNYPDSLRLRQMAPPAIVFALLLSGLLALFSIFLGWTYTLAIAAIAAMGYLTSLTIGYLLSSKNTSLLLLPGIISAFVVMHLSWGSGFWISLFKNRKDTIK